MNYIKLLVLMLLALSRPGLGQADGVPPHDFAQWENEISAFERMDRTNPPPTGGILFIC